VILLCAMSYELVSRASSQALRLLYEFTPDGSVIDEDNGQDAAFIVMMVIVFGVLGILGLSLWFCDGG